eukprot:TRINITY_DN38855_c0_g1_i1.p1 TRINITY_DN38855_c0_g1~~TRINITY_DN38855_c0_g1_i1.p1  ORF type:complete len:421 (+),score=104.15 TRINITY_DN38855_c0_g1_i1:22-1263(+)
MVLDAGSPESRALPVAAIECAEQNCCVCFVRTRNSTPCGHKLCRPCLQALKSRACPMCRRPLPPPGPVDLAALLREAHSEDLTGLQQAYRMAEVASSPKAAEARRTIAESLAKKLEVLDLTALAAEIALLPLEEPAVLAAASGCLKAASVGLQSLGALLGFVSEVSPLRAASFELRLNADKLLQDALQGLVPALSLAELEISVEDLRRLKSQPGVDDAIMSIHLQEALLRGLQGFDGGAAQRFAGAARALAGEKLLDESQEVYIASVFAARLSCHLASASLQELDWIEESVLPLLPNGAAWTQAEAAVLRCVSRRAELLEKTGPALRQLHRQALEPVQPQGARQARVEGFMSAMRHIDSRQSTAAGTGPSAARALSAAGSSRQAADLPVQHRRASKAGKIRQVRTREQILRVA